MVVIKFDYDFLSSSSYNFDIVKLKAYYSCDPSPSYNFNIVELKAYVMKEDSLSTELDFENSFTIIIAWI